jgi:hypothetical protein
MTDARFADETLELLAAAHEVRIETWGAGEPHRTTIWVVVVDGVPYVRSYRGPAARWYGEIRVEPHGAIHVGDRRVPVRAVAADDEASVAACSAGLSAKYSGDPSLAAMLAPEVAGTTLRLEPA